MSEEERPSWTSTVFSWQGVLMLAAILGFATSPHPFSPPWPSPSAATETERTWSQREIYGRPWEDPWEAITRAEKQRKSAKVSETSPTEVASSRQFGSFDLALPSDIESSSKPSICILPVIVRGDLHSREAAETRTRFRAAVSTGLGISGYKPDKPDRLSLARVALPGLQEQRKEPALLPYEWFVSTQLPRSNQRLYTAVMVVWIPDQLLFDTPLKHLLSLQDQLTRGLATAWPIPPTCIPAVNVDFRVIGPYWSGILVDMVRELRRKSTSGFADLHIYSSSATMADGLLELLAADSANNPGDVSENHPSVAAAREGRAFIRDRIPHFHTLNCTDDQLARDLLQELSIRGVNPLDEQNRIAIISDWDTDYGRVLPITFAAVLNSLRIANGNYKEKSGLSLQPARAPALADFRNLQTDAEITWPKQILRIHYPSELEGPFGVHEAKADADSFTGGSKSPGQGEIEPAYGPRRIDYIRRLATTLRVRIAEHDTPGRPHGTLRAIGIMGSSTFDKLLLLEALSPLFPDVIFFTTELDARFTHPAIQPYTQNLIVASSFGLELFRAFQQGVPPARDGIQTGTFLAVQAAMEADDTVSDHLQYAPQMFEIGRNRAVDLLKPWDSASDDIKEDLTLGASKWRGPLYPLVSIPGRKAGHEWQETSGLLLKLVIGVACLIALALLISFGRLRVERRNPYITISIKLAALGLAIVSAFFLLFDNVEPLSFMESVSIWPSELIRLIAFLCAVAFLIFSQHQIDAVTRGIAREFGLPLPRQNTDLNACTEATIGSIFGSIPANRKFLTSGASPRYVESERLWSDFIRSGRHLARYTRALVMTCLYITACLLIVGIIGQPIIPFRGSYSQMIDQWLTYASGITTIFLMFTVVSATRGCRRFINRLSQPFPTDWQHLWQLPETRAFLPLDQELKGDSDARQLLKNGVAYFADIKAMGILTKTANNLIYYPFIALSLMIFARWTFWANWRWTPFVVIIYTADAVICIFCALQLRWEAVRAKRDALAEMDRYIAVIRSKAADSRWDRIRSVIEHFRDEVAENLDGAFLPWTQQPVLKAALIPLGSTGLTQLLQYHLG